MFTSKIILWGGILILYAQQVMSFLFSATSLSCKIVVLKFRGNDFSIEQIYINCKCFTFSSKVCLWNSADVLDDHALSLCWFSELFSWLCKSMAEWSEHRDKLWLNHGSKNLNNVLWFLFELLIASVFSSSISWTQRCMERGKKVILGINLNTEVFLYN